MAYLPIFFDVTDRSCLVVGGGEVAARKVTTLLEAGADVTVISPAIIEALENLVRERRIRHLARAYEPGDMAGMALVYAATDDPELHQRLHAEASERGIPINVADAPEFCTFITPAILTRGSLKIAVSTEGAGPAMAKRIVGRLGRLFGPEYGLTMEVLRAARHHLKAVEPDIKVRARKLTALARSRIPEYLRKNDSDAVDRILHRHIGVGLDALGLSTMRNRDAGARDEAPPSAR
jgi:precorrin-2 dehydrogenase/sirohydrochlorin ferrochelatase